MVLASDAERDQTIDYLGRACSEGRLTLGELDERVEAALSARSRDELAALVVDLPVSPPEAAPSAATAPSSPPVLRSVTLVGRLRHRGRWRLPARVLHVALVGGASLDLRDAEVSSPVTTITVVCGAGRIRVRLPEHVRVEIAGASGLGGRRSSIHGEARPGAPVVRLRLYALSGRIRITQRRG
jgi:hypothetical protein